MPETNSYTLTTSHSSWVRHGAIPLGAASVYTKREPGPLFQFAKSVKRVRIGWSGNRDIAKYIGQIYFYYLLYK